MTIDLHLDTLWKMTKYGAFDLREGAEYSDVSFASLKAGGLQGAVFALYLAHHLECDAERLVEEQIEAFKAQRWPEGFKGYLAMEGGQLLRGQLGNLEKYAKAGIVYLTLTHNYNNLLGSSATDPIEDYGLTNFGVEVVNQCHKLGVLVDISHSSERTAKMATYFGRVIASHSGARAIINHPRNVSDDVIKRIARNDGLVGVPFVRKFIGSRAAIADHIDHIVQLVGIKHAAIGSDIDGAVTVAEMPQWYEAVSEGLAKRGYSEAAIAAVAGGNFQRLLEAQ